MEGPAGANRTTAYRRQARRIRGRLADKPLERYAALRRLSDHHDSGPCSAPPVPQPPRTAVNTFAQLAASQLADDVLCYSRRLQLLNTAGRLGIGRFQANLILAAVQHESGNLSVRSQEASAPRPFRVAPILAVAVIQSLILFGVWGIFFR